MDSKEALIELLTQEGALKTPRLIDAFGAIDRADFVPKEYWSHAYGDYPLPIGYDQTISQPWTVAFLLELLDPHPGEKILDIGTGSGWTTALLAEVATKKPEGMVLGIERIKEIYEVGKKNIARYQFPAGSVQIFRGDGTRGLKRFAPYHKILASAAASREIPKSWRDQLAVGGRIVAPVGGSVWVFEKQSETAWQETEYPGFSFVPLIGGSSLVKKWGWKKLLAVAVVVGVNGVGALLLNEISYPHTSYHGTKTITIPPGYGSRMIADLLRDEGAIRSTWAFAVYVTVTNTASYLKPGTYTVGEFAIPDITRLLLAGEEEREITIPEGWTIEEIGEYLEREKIVSKTEWLAVAAHPPAQTVIDRFSFLRDLPKNRTLEGYLFPDTYRIRPRANAKEIAMRMLENFDRKLTPELREEITRQKKNIFDIVTMASMIEREVATDEDRTRVAGILWKRLEKKIPLQVDATIIYLKAQRGIKKTDWLPITANDLKIDSPYNTYKYSGLPYSPIANPGISAIRASIYPQGSTALFYLSAKDGRTIFSQTLTEHARARERYLK